MKLVEIKGKAVGDTKGLMSSMQAYGFKVHNVASDKDKTFVWLDDFENKDPKAIVDGWQDCALLTLSVDSEIVSNGISEAPADGNACLVVSVKKTSPETKESVLGDERLLVLPSRPIEISDDRPVLLGGFAVFTVGPTKRIGEVTIRVADPEGRMRSAEALIRFVAPENKFKEYPVTDQNRQDRGLISKVSDVFFGNKQKEHPSINYSDDSSVSSGVDLSDKSSHWAAFVNAPEFDMSGQKKPSLFSKFISFFTWPDRKS